MNDVLTSPQYDAIVLRDRVAYPVEREDADALVRALTGRSGCVPLDWESVGEVTLRIDDDTYRATFTCAGEWPDPCARHGANVRMLVAVTNVRVVRLSGGREKEGRSG